METRPTPSGLPALAGALAFFACRTVTTYEAGDHRLFIGEVEPLVFHGGRYRELCTMDRAADRIGA